MSFARPSPRYATAVCSSRAAVRLFCKSSVEQLGQHKRSSTYRGFSCRVSASHVPGVKPCFSLRIGCAPTQRHNLCAYAAVYAFGLSASAAIKPSNSVRSSPEVVLTREQGKNGKLRKELEKRGISCLELPLIETDSGPDRDSLPTVLANQTFDWVCLTSPESANVFMAGWRAAGRPSGLRIAVVGEGTGEVLVEEEGDALRPQFVPSAADAVHFSAELPHVPGGANTVLYPASSKAGATLQEGLQARGFHVTRLNTYTTVPVASISPELLQTARGALVVTAASPSTIKSWVKFCGGPEETDVAVACIGSTSARAAEQLGISRIYYPELPGIEGFVTSIEQALADCKRS